MNLVYVGTLPPHPGGSAIVGAQLTVACASAGDTVRAIAPTTPDALRAGGDRFAAAHPAIAVRRFTMPYFESAPNHPAGAEYRRREGEEIQRLLGGMVDDARPDLVLIGRETFAWHVPEVARAHGIPTVMLAQGATTAGMLDGSMAPGAVEALTARFRMVDRIVLVAKNLVERYRRLGLPSCDVVQNGVDLRRFAPAPKSAAVLDGLGIRRDRVVVAHVSNLKDLKRPLDVVAAAALALRHDARLVFVIVGEGPMRAAMEAACRDAGVTDAFRFIGWVEHAEVPAYLNAADLVVMPSASEALALAYLETMACGRVLIASEIPAAREVVRDGVNGLLFRTGDVAELADRILTAAADPSLRARLGAAARATMERHHDLTTVVGRYRELFGAIIGRP